MRLKIDVEGMSCSHCKLALEQALGQLEGVRRVEIDLAKNQANIEAEEGLEDIIVETITQAGYRVKNK